MLIDSIDQSKTQNRPQKYNKGRGMQQGGKTSMMNKIRILYFMMD